MSNYVGSALDQADTEGDTLAVFERLLQPHRTRQTERRVIEIGFSHATIGQHRHGAKP